MFKHSYAFDKFLDFSCVINQTTRKQILAITETHPVLKNHPVIQSLEKEQPALISISRLSEVHEAILSHSVVLAKTAGSGDTKTCLRAIMEQNVLTNASNALNALIMEQYRNNIDRLSRIVDTTRSHDFDDPEFDEDIDYLKELERDADEEISKDFRKNYDA